MDIVLGMISGGCFVLVLKNRGVVKWVENRLLLFYKIFLQDVSISR